MPRGVLRLISAISAAMIIVAGLSLSMRPAEGSARVASTSHAHHHADTTDGTPCTGHDPAHDLACCLAGGCAIMSGWIVEITPTPAAPTRMRGAYLIASTPHPKGLTGAPTRKPPRRTV